MNDYSALPADLNQAKKRMYELEQLVKIMREQVKTAEKA